MRQVNSVQRSQYDSFVQTRQALIRSHFEAADESTQTAQSNLVAIPADAFALAK
jgi:hypothetical protein